MVWEKPEKAQKCSDMLGKNPKRLRNGLGQARSQMVDQKRPRNGLGETQKSSDMEPK